MPISTEAEEYRAALRAKAGLVVHVHRGRKNHIARNAGLTLCGEIWVAILLTEAPWLARPMCQVCEDRKDQIEGRDRSE